MTQSSSLSTNHRCIRNVLGQLVTSEDITTTTSPSPSKAAYHVKTKIEEPTPLKRLLECDDSYYYSNKYMTTQFLHSADISFLQNAQPIQVQDKEVRQVKLLNEVHPSLLLEEDDDALGKSAEPMMRLDDNVSDDESEESEDSSAFSLMMRTSWAWCDKVARVKRSSSQWRERNKKNRGDDWYHLSTKGCWHWWMHTVR